jgi:hypothetical protein
MTTMTALDTRIAQVRTQLLHEQTRMQVLYATANWRGGRLHEANAARLTRQLESLLRQQHERDGLLQLRFEEFDFDNGDAGRAA